MKAGKILLVGQVFVDVTLDVEKIDDTKLRLGGITHAARGLWSIDQPYTSAYLAPEYLTTQVEDYFSKIGCTGINKIGNIVGCPNIQLIKNSKETGSQIYRNILHEHTKISYNHSTFVDLFESDTFSRVLIFPGAFPIDDMLQYLDKKNVEVILDINYLDNPIESLKSFDRKFEAIFLSTSSQIFLNQCKKSINILSDVLRPRCDKLIFKENRGGTRYFDFGKNQLKNIPSFTRTISHSIGVGDCFDAIYCSLFDNNYSDEKSLKYASLIASEYAATSFPEDFKAAVQAWCKISCEEIYSLKGISVPFEEREKIDVYIAAPDFDYVDTVLIDELEESLKYHNFTPHRPIQENGQAQKNSSLLDKNKLLSADLDLLYSCKILVVVLLFDDPGTLIELGIAIEKRIPTIVYDPLNKAKNLFLTQLPKLVSSSLDEILTLIFELADKIIHEK